MDITSQEEQDETFLTEIRYSPPSPPSPIFSSLAESTSNSTFETKIDEKKDKKIDEKIEDPKAESTTKQKEEKKEKTKEEKESTSSEYKSVFVTPSVQPPISSVSFTTPLLRSDSVSSDSLEERYKSLSESSSTSNRRCGISCDCICC